MVRHITTAAFVLGGLLFVAGAAAFLLDHPLGARLTTRWVPPAVPAAGSPEEQGREVSAFRTLGREVNGTLVWSSNRAGNHELYRADLATGAVSRLTNHPHVDYLSRYSPDGRRISFLRSRRAWVSFREVDGWDLMVMNADGSDQRRLVERAYHAMWTPDGGSITFTRDNKVMAVDVSSAQERLIYDGADDPTAGRIDEPMLGPDDRLAFALKGVSRARRGVGILSLKTRRFERVSPEPSACEIGWIGKTGRVVWIEGSGHGGTRVMHTATPNGEPQVLIDLPGTHSHEYFPVVTQDTRWLIWGAAAEGHEHDRADYEIFAWRIGTPAESAIRLTWSTSNDQWPDLWVN
jgi:dipeptidyl aminopeptidase/acylaminoacyl peptidase